MHKMFRSDYTYTYFNTKIKLFIFLWKKKTFNEMKNLELSFWTEKKGSIFLYHFDSPRKSENRIIKISK